MLKGSTRAWLHTLPPGLIRSWEDFQVEFMVNFWGTYVRLADANNLSIMKQGKNESIFSYWTRF